MDNNKRDKDRIRKYFLVSPSGGSVIFGASFGRIAGFSFNVIDGVQPGYYTHIKFLKDKVKEGFKIIDSEHNILSLQDMINFIDHWRSDPPTSTEDYSGKPIKFYNYDWRKSNNHFFKKFMANGSSFSYIREF